MDNLLLGSVAFLLLAVLFLVRQNHSLQLALARKQHKRLPR